MSGYRFSRRADDDLREIAEYGTPLWGEPAALGYAAKLEAACAIVASRPGIARRCNRVRAGYFRYEVGSHVLFIIRDARGIKIVRVLHQRMQPVIAAENEDE